jgi:two-component system, OmpR family, phosphate regulon sensor histidine kinase PhoR
LRECDLMHEKERQMEVIESCTSVRPTEIATQPIIWSMTANPQKRPDFQSVLLAITGHDLRQPLQVIGNVHDLLREGPRTASELGLLRYSQSAVDRLREQLDELLAALRIYEDLKGVKLMPVRVGPLLQKVCRLNEAPAARRGVSIRAVPTCATIQSDGLLLGAVLRNLVSNAIKYTEPGGRILVGCRHIGLNVRIDVYDSGIGIARDEIGRIFEAFSRLDPRRQDGLGMGLFIVRQAVAILGHRIDVASIPVRGSRFSVFANQANGTSDESAERSRQSSDADRADPSSMPVRP